MEFLTTGCKALDQLLGGGVSTGEITELVGEYAAGKGESQLTILVENLGRNKEWSAIFMDSENTFRVVRLREIAKARGYDPEDIVSRTLVVRAPASEQYHHKR